MENSNPKIYVACLASYNNGILYGRWIDALQDADDIYKEIFDMLANSPIPHAEEWEIHDYEYLPASGILKSMSIDEISNMAKFIHEHGNLASALIDYYGCLEDAEEALDDYYHGEWGSELDFATQLFDDIYIDNFPDNLCFYIDYKAFSYDIFINDYFSLDVDGKTHVFSLH